jgi:hypothetical protein
LTRRVGIVFEHRASQAQVGRRVPPVALQRRAKRPRGVGAVVLFQEELAPGRLDVGVVARDGRDVTKQSIGALEFPEHVGGARGTKPGLGIVGISAPQNPSKERLAFRSPAEPPEDEGQFECRGIVAPRMRRQQGDGLGVPAAGAGRVSSKNGRSRVACESGHERLDLVVFTRVEGALGLRQQQLLIRRGLDEFSDQAFIARAGQLDGLAVTEIGREEERQDGESEKPQPHMGIRPAVGPHTRV